MANDLVMEPNERSRVTSDGVMEPNRRSGMTSDRVVGSEKHAFIDIDRSTASEQHPRAYRRLALGLHHSYHPTCDSGPCDWRYSVLMDKDNTLRFGIKEAVDALNDHELRLHASILKSIMNIETAEKVGTLLKDETCIQSFEVSGNMLVFELTTFTQIYFTEYLTV